MMREKGEGTKDRECLYAISNFGLRRHFIFNVRRTWIPGTMYRCEEEFCFERGRLQG